MQDPLQFVQGPALFAPPLVVNPYPGTVQVPPVGQAVQPWNAMEQPEWPFHSSGHGGNSFVTPTEKSPVHVEESFVNSDKTSPGHAGHPFFTLGNTSPIDIYLRAHAQAEQSLQREEERKDENKSIRYFTFIYFLLVALLPRPKCCGPPPVIPNAQVTYLNGTCFDDYALYACDGKYELTPWSTSPIAICGNGNWVTGMVCIISCGEPPDKTDLGLELVTPGYTFVGTVRYYVCIDKTLSFVLGSGTQACPKIVCQEDGTWTDFEATCGDQTTGNEITPTTTGVDLATSGSWQSPLYPEVFPDDFTAYYRTLISKKENIEFEFDFFNVSRAGDESPCRGLNAVRIYCGIDQPSPDFAFCGQEKPDTTTCNTECAIVVFAVPPFSDGYDGFDLEWKGDDG